MSDYSLVPVDYRPDFSDVSLVPVDHDPFREDGVVQQMPAELGRPQSSIQSPATGAGQPNVMPSANTGEAAAGESYTPSSRSTVSASGQPDSPSAAPISLPDMLAPPSQQRPDGISAPGTTGGGGSPWSWKSLLQSTINATVPGAHYANLAEQQFRQGNYGAAAVYEAAAFGDAALGAVTLGTSTRLGTAARAAETLAPANLKGELSASAPTGKFYSVLHEMKLSPTSYPGRLRPVHNQEANENLLREMESDLDHARIMQDGGVNLIRTPTGLAPRTPPNDWTWHHAEEPGVMQLVPTEQHKPGSIFQGVLHPEGRGGYYKWGKK